MGWSMDPAKRTVSIHSQKKVLQLWHLVWPQWIFELTCEDIILWKTDILQDVSVVSTVQNILTVKSLRSLTPDKFRWTVRAHGEFTIKEAYLLDQNHRLLRDSHFELAHWKIHEKFKLSLRKIMECAANRWSHWAKNIKRDLSAYFATFKLKPYALSHALFGPTDAGLCILTPQGT